MEIKMIIILLVNKRHNIYIWVYAYSINWTKRFCNGVGLLCTLRWLIADMPIAILGLEGEGRSFTSALEHDI